MSYRGLLAKEEFEKCKRVAQPLVSVVIPSLPSRVEQRKKALETVEQQTYPHIETIVETGGSNAQEARNIAIEKANGKYVAMLDDDDEWHPEKIERQVAFMEKHDECGICLTHVRDERIEGTYMDYTPKRHVSYSDLLRGFAIAPTSCFLIRMADLQRYGGFREDFRFAHEYELTMRFAKNGSKVMTVQEYLTFYGVNQAERLSDNYFDYIRGHFDLLREYGVDMARESVIMALLRQTFCIPLFFVGCFATEFIHQFFYKFKSLHTRGKL